jgi:hypothetical protein
VPNCVCVVYGFHKGGETDGAGLPGVTEPHEELLPTHRKAYMPSSGLIWRQSTGTSVYIYRPTTLALVFENMEMKVLKYFNEEKLRHFASIPVHSITVAQGVCFGSIP